LVQDLPRIVTADNCEQIDQYGEKTQNFPFFDSNTPLIHQVIEEEHEHEGLSSNFNNIDNLPMNTNNLDDIDENSCQKSTNLNKSNNSQICPKNPTTIFNLTPIFSQFPSSIPTLCQSTRPPQNTQTRISLDPTSPSYQTQSYQQVFGLQNKISSSDVAVNYVPSQSPVQNQSKQINNQQRSTVGPFTTGFTGVRRHQPVIQAKIPRDNHQSSNKMVTRLNNSLSNGMKSPYTGKIGHVDGFERQKGSMAKGRFGNIQNQFSLHRQQLLNQHAQIAAFQNNVHSLEQSLQQITQELNTFSNTKSDALFDGQTTENYNNNNDSFPDSQIDNNYPQTASINQNTSELHSITNNISQALRDWYLQIELVEQCQSNFIELFEAAESIRNQRTIIKQRGDIDNDNNGNNNHDDGKGTDRNKKDDLEKEMKQLREKEQHFLDLRKKFATRKNELQVIQSRTLKNNDDFGNKFGQNRNNLNHPSQNTTNGAPNQSTYLVKSIQQLQSKLNQLELNKQQQYKQQQDKLQNIVTQLKSSQKEYKSILTINRGLRAQNSSLQMKIIGLKNKNKILKMSQDRFKTQLQQYREHQKQSFMNTTSVVNRSFVSSNHNNTKFIKKTEKENNRIAQSLGLNNLPSYMQPLRNSNNGSAGINNNSLNASMSTNALNNTSIGLNATTMNLTTSTPTTPRGSAIKSNTFGPCKSI
jgi:hypothetical protein